MAGFLKRYHIILFSLLFCMGVAIGQERELSSDAAPDSSTGTADTTRSKVSTNTEKSDRDDQEKEIADAPPPENRVRNRPSKLPK